MINQLIAIFLPDILGLKQCDNIFRKEENLWKRLEIYLLLVMFTNFISYTVVVYVFREKYFEFTNQFTIKYIVLNALISYFIPIVMKIVKKNINVKFVVKENEK